MRLSERSDLPFIGAREGGERLCWELKRTRETKTFQLSRDLSYTRSAWQKFRHRLGSFPQPAAHRDEAWRGVARRAAAEERAWMSLLFSCSYMWGKNLPYKEVQLPLN